MHPRAEQRDRLAEGIGHRPTRRRELVHAPAVTRVVALYYRRADADDKHRLDRTRRHQAPRRRMRRLELAVSVRYDQRWVSPRARRSIPKDRPDDDLVGLAHRWRRERERRDARRGDWLGDQRLRRATRCGAQRQDRDQECSRIQLSVRWGHRTRYEGGVESPARGRGVAVVSPTATLIRSCPSSTGPP